MVNVYTIFERFKMPTEVISTVLPDGSKKIDLKIGLNIPDFS